MSDAAFGWVFMGCIFALFVLMVWFESRNP